MTTEQQGQLPRRSFLSRAVGVAAGSMLAGGVAIAAAPRAAAAAGANVTWRLSSDWAEAKEGYRQAIRGIQSSVSGNHRVGTDGSRPVWVTDENGTTQFTTVDLHAEDRREVIRLFMRQSDAYILGWRRGLENSDGTVAWGNFFTLEAGVNLPGADRGTNGNVDPRHERLSTYTELERQGGITREGLQIGIVNLNHAVLTLYNGANSTVRDVAQGLLRIIVALAEGSRFINQAAATAQAFGRGAAYTVTAEHAQQHTSWLDLSRQFLDWLAANWQGGGNHPWALVLMMAHHSNKGTVHRRDELLERSTWFVSPDGFADHTTVQDAIDEAFGVGENRIIIDKGIYHEAISVPSTKSFLTIRGLTGNRADVVIYNTRCHGMINPSTGLKYGTQGSAVATFRPPNLTVKDLTISNGFDRGAHPEINPYETQAVAVAAMGDRQVFDNVAIMSRQDTLLVKGQTPTTEARQYFVGCFIRGDVDFIFGNATAVIDRSTIQMLSWPNGTVLAPNTDGSKKYGILLSSCTINTSGVTSDTMHLGRPWNNTAEAWPQAVVRACEIGSGVKDAQPWTDMLPDQPWRLFGRFREYHNFGPGAGHGSESPQLTDAEAAEYTAQKYLAGTDGWNPIGI